MHIFFSILRALLPKTAHAVSIQDVGSGPGIAGMWSFMSPLPHIGDNAIIVVTRIVINAVLWAIGSAAVLMILYGALRMITSGGNDESVRKAWKEIILYACLGLIFAVLSSIIVNFVYNLAVGIATS